jgi:hypothetical protein
MRLILVIVLPIVAAGLLTGCSGADAGRAQSLLQQAEQAQQSLTSEHMIMKLDMDADGQSVQIDMAGGGYLRGARAGDFYLSLTGSLPTGSAALDMLVVRQGTQVSVRANGRTETLPLSQAQTRLGGNLGNVSQFSDLARYVKSVSVSEADFQGRPADKVVGTLDTGELLSSAGGPAAQLFSNLGVHASDVRAVLFIPRDTHLVEAMLADLTISAQGHDVHMKLSLALTGLNQPVDFPLT